VVKASIPFTYEQCHRKTRIGNIKSVLLTPSAGRRRLDTDVLLNHGHLVGALSQWLPIHLPINNCTCLEGADLTVKSSHSTAIVRSGEYDDDTEDYTGVEGVDIRRGEFGEGCDHTSDQATKPNKATTVMRLPAPDASLEQTALVSVLRLRGFLGCTAAAGPRFRSRVRSRDLSGWLEMNLGGRPRETWKQILTQSAASSVMILEDHCSPSLMRIIP
jgi:hypothetical protein